MKVNIYAIAFLFTSCFLYTSCKKDKIEPKGRLTEVSYVGSQWKMALKYNADGKLVSTQQYGADTLFYDNQGRLIKYNDGNVTYAFEYTSNGQIKRRTPVSTAIPNYHPDTIEYRYDEVGRLVESISTFNDPYNIPQEGWIRDYTYNSQNDITGYGAINTYYHQSEWATLSYDNGANPLKLSNSIMFFLNENFYEALNQHNPKRKDTWDITSIYSYEYSGTLPDRQAIKSYSRGQPLDPFGYNSMQQLIFSYE